MTHVANWGAWRDLKWGAAASSPSAEAYHILHIGFTAVPVIAGLDKFANLLVNWEQYLAPAVTRAIGGYSHEFMLVVGLIEIVAGIGVALKPKIFGYVVAAWLLGIVVNLVMTGFYDIALRDAGLCLGALALARMAMQYDHQFERKVQTS